jgi:hypothetical protein
VKGRSIPFVIWHAWIDGADERIHGERIRVHEGTIDRALDLLRRAGVIHMDVAAFDMSVAAIFNGWS